MVWESGRGVKGRVDGGGIRLALKLSLVANPAHFIHLVGVGVDLGEREGSEG